jgi:molybdopterin biosynthesis enzyme
MLRDQIIGFMQTAIVFLLLTNAVSALVAFYAMKTANLLARPGEAKSGIERRLEALLTR